MRWHGTDEEALLESFCRVLGNCPVGQLLVIAGLLEGSRKNAVLWSAEPAAVRLSSRGSSLFPCPLVGELKGPMCTPSLSCRLVFKHAVSHLWWAKLQRRTKNYGLLMCGHLDFGLAQAHPKSKCAHISWSRQTVQELTWSIAIVPVLCMKLVQFCHRSFSNGY